MYTKTWNEDYKWKQLKRTRTYYTPSAPWVQYDGSLPLVQSRSGTRVEDWRGKIQRGEFAGSPFTSDRCRTLSLVPGDVSVYQAVKGYPTSWVVQEFSGYQSMPGSQISHLLTTSEVENKALGRILEKIRAEQFHADSMVALAELGDTLRQFGHPAQAILELSNRHLNRVASEMRGVHGVQRKIKWLEVVARSYLEWAFGVAPLIEDTRKTAEALARWKGEAEGELPRPTHSDLKASAKASSGDFAFTQSTAVSPQNMLLYTKHVKKTTDVGCIYRVRLSHSLQADFGSNDRLLQLLGFDPKRWAPTIYEALPWSWLLDYFTNLGAIIDAGFTDTSHVSWIQKTVRSETNEFWSHPLDLQRMKSTFGSSSYDFKVSGLHLGQAAVNRVTLVRTLPESLGLPSFSTTYPTGLKQIANMSAALFSRRPTNSSPLWVM